MTISKTARAWSPALGIVCALAGAFAAPDVSAQEREVRVVNKTHRIMRALHVASVGTNQWGKDLLGARLVRTGREMLVAIPHGGACLLDLRATFTGDIRLVRRNVDICRVRSWTITK